MTTMNHTTFILQQQNTTHTTIKEYHYNNTHSKNETNHH